MRDLLNVAWVLGACVGIFAGARATAQETKAVKLLMLGDSHVARGMAAATEGPLNELMRDKVAWTVINGGVGGDDARATTERLPKLLTDNKPDFVIISFGGNDQYKKHSVERFRDNVLRGFGAVNGYAQKSGVTPPVVLLMTCPPVDGNRHFTGKDPALNAQGGIDFILDSQYYGELRKLAHEKGVALIDVHRFLSDKDVNQITLKDGVHLSEQGYKTAGPYVAQVIAAWYQAETLKDEKVLKIREDASAKLKALTPSAAKAATDAAAKKDLLAKLEEIWKQCPYLAEQSALWNSVAYAGAKPVVAAKEEVKK